MQSIDNVSISTKANLYFGGRVVSHSITLQDGSKKTIGLIFPGSYHFGTNAPERMEITHGDCSVTIDGATAPQRFSKGSYFDVPANSGFTIQVDTEICQYICSFLPE